jgi:plasmid stabilization system protein ParE
LTVALSIDFLNQARLEFDDAFDWYAARSVEAATGFAESIQVALNSIAESPETFLTTYAACRRYLLKRYPYGIIYKEHNNSVVVVATANTRRKPDYWHSRG